LGEIGFRDEDEFGLEMIDNAMEECISFFDVTMDEFYKGNTKLLTVFEN
jgi:hypothetical protein